VQRSPDFPSMEPEQFIVDCIYSSAIEPIRFEHLIETWDRQLQESGYSKHALALFSSSVLSQHVSRAQDIATAALTPPDLPVVETAVLHSRTAAFTCSKAGCITAANKAATAVLNIAAGMPINSLPLSPEAIEQFRFSVGEVIAARGDRQDLLRFKSSSHNRTVFAFLSAIQDEHNDRHALIITTEHVWQGPMEKALQKTFSLTPAETNVLRLIMSGVSTAEIAVSLQKAEATVRSQIHKLLEKTGTRSQAELMSVTLAFTDVVTDATVSAVYARHPPITRLNPFETLILPDNRRLDYLRLGDPGGKAFLWLHGNLSQCRLPRAAEQWLKDRQIAMVVPIRAGYGFSSPLPRKNAPIETAVSDIGHLRRHLRIGNGPVVAHGNDFMLACVLARELGPAVTAIIGIGATLPIERPEDYARLGKWARIFRANARYAPNVINLLGRGAHALIKVVGFETYLQRAMSGSPDVEAFRDPEIRAAVIAGAEIVFGPDAKPYEAFAADIIATHSNAWPDLDKLVAPVTLFQGEQDRNSNHELAVEYCGRYAGWSIRSFPGTGNFVHHVQWRPLVEFISGCLSN
jgi:DNA-binding CsgD family transcriptional regulator/pimeloyl-ACP methyl ester carboxylesterase